ncbi:methyltransferase [Pseudoalteromonas piscicida]|uniref:Methyltransferase n=1 Tax=Pseudoalteromonas piscicida TaxID=43662 RepID=A0A2A5JMX6_PSEO7|nr:methyltransferase [Pseudoalteromonas piscicida]PCK30786.1 methyltransferase [Pseudoalteromonas piscicida]
MAIVNPSTRFQRLDKLLFDTRQYWQIVAFEHLTIPWSHLAPQLQQLSDSAVCALDNDPQAHRDFFKGVIPELEELHALCALPRIQGHRDELPFWLSNGIKGRKLEQLQDFVAAINETKASVLEWCAGKGHLGRMLAYHGAPEVNSIELQADLCRQGEESAKRQDLNLHFHCADVLKDDIHHHFVENRHGIALHACGELHRVFMRQAVENGMKKLSLSPCCYHLFTPPLYEAMSEEAQSSPLNLSHHDMKLALQETVTAPGRVAEIRKKEVSWRLGFDALRRELQGDNHYLSVPSVNKAIFSGAFSEFCDWAAAQKQLTLPVNIDFDKYERIGRERKQVTDRIELVRHLFRRAIEIWLVLDRVLYLQAAGYDVSLSTFCEKSLTPRNILIQADYQPESH